VVEEETEKTDVAEDAKRYQRAREISCSLGGRRFTYSSSSQAFSSIYSTSITWWFVGWHF
jgi:hypothetical protein